MAFAKNVNVSQNTPDMQCEFRPVIGNKYHIALTMSIINKSATLYIDGKVSKTIPFDGTGLPSTQGITIGNYGINAGYGVRAKVRNLRVTQACRYAGSFKYTP